MRIIGCDDPARRIDEAVVGAALDQDRQLFLDLGGVPEIVVVQERDLRGGEVEQVGAPLELYDDPANMFVAGFIGSPKMNFLDAEVAEVASGQATIALKSQPNVRVTLPITANVNKGDKVTLGVRPEHFVDAGQGNADLDLDVDVAEHLGSTSYVYAHIGNGERIIVEREESRAATNKDKLTVGISAASSFLFDGAGKRLR